MTGRQARRLLGGARVAVLGTIGPAGRPNLVPVTFALVDDMILTGVDEKPKRTTALQRHADLRRDPRATVLAQHWDEDWTTLWWVRATGTATIHDEGPELESALGLLLAKYPQYRSMAVGPPVIAITVSNWTGWEADAHR